jgi:hypothetical protein
MRRGQATIEYTLLVAVLAIGGCLLVRFPTPVEWTARSIAHALAYRGPAAHHHPARTRPRRQRRPPHRRVHACLCPAGGPESGRLTSP